MCADAGTPAWRPILSGASRATALAAVEAIVASTWDVSDPYIALERVLLLDYAERAGIDGAGDQAAALFEEAIARLAEVPQSHRLLGGMSGLGWMVSHLAAPEDADAVCSHIDAALLAALDQTDWKGDFDLVRGLAGIGIYAVERAHTSTGRALAARVIDLLERAAHRDRPGLTWFTPPELLPEVELAGYPDGFFNYGVAHGLPGVVGMLGRFVGAGLETDRAGAMWRGGLAHLSTIAPGRGPARFPSCLAPTNSGAGIPTRFAWCYGDPGIAVALLAAGRTCGDASRETEAIELACAMLGRPFDDWGASDAGLCHGAAGLGLMLHHLHHATGHAPFQHAAQHWYEDALARRQSAGGIAGFTNVRLVKGVPVDDDDASLITGAVGIALALLAAATDVEPAWDRMLLFDVPSADSQS